ncbi:MAG TPA: hypothetical protein VMT85_04050 [Thermoanaerobaculia bacterium]|nr:hypothetical protein [Thermoanaerobaculia bacterium]
MALSRRLALLLLAGDCLVLLLASSAAPAQRRVTETTSTSVIEGPWGGSIVQTVTTPTGRTFSLTEPIHPLSERHVVVVDEIDGSTRVGGRIGGFSGSLPASGDLRFLVVPVESTSASFAEGELADLDGVLADVKRQYDIVSHGALRLSFDLHPIVSLSHYVTCTNFIQSRVERETDSIIDRQPGEHDGLVLVFPEQIFCPGGASAISSLTRTSYLPGEPALVKILKPRDAPLLEHEIGHNLGQLHAATPNDEVGDSSSIMGYDFSHMRGPNAPQRAFLGWARALELEHDGVYEIVAASLERDAAPNVLLLRAGDDTLYSVSFRPGLDVRKPSNQSPTVPPMQQRFVDGATIHRIVEQPDLRSPESFLEKVDTIVVATMVDGREHSFPGGIVVEQISHGDESLLVRVSGLAEAEVTCTPGPQILCLEDGRFQVEARFGGSSGSLERARAEELTTDSGYFWFFDSDNVELVVKVLDACAVSGDYWVLATGLTDVATELTVTDTIVQRERSYESAAGAPFETVIDVEAFSCF